MNWKESGFSGDDYLLFETPANARWSVHVNRYGPPVAKLYFMSDHGGGIPLFEQALPADVTEDSVLVRLSQEWARNLIESGEADRRLVFSRLAVAGVHRTIMQCLLDARAGENLEECLLSLLDDLWGQMTESEREEERVIAARRATTGSAAPESPSPVRYLVTKVTQSVAPGITFDDEEDIIEHP